MRGRRQGGGRPRRHERKASLTLPAIQTRPSIRRGPVVPHEIIQPPFVRRVALLSLADDAGEFFDRINLWF